MTDKDNEHLALKGPRFMLAPMEGISDVAFRHWCHLHGAEVTFTEMARVDALLRGNRATWQRLMRDSTPTILQVLASRPKDLDALLRGLPDRFDGINLNLGCPGPEIVRSGQGCAMIKRISRVQELVQVIKRNGYEASIKMRLGLNAYEKERKAYLHLIDAVDAEFFVIHARHGRQSSAQPADWSVFPELVATGKRIIANGDISEPLHLQQLAGVAGVMIGRAAVHDPCVFARLRGQKCSADLDEYLALAKTYKTPRAYVDRVTLHASTGVMQG